ncbi:metallophosphatase family protein [Maribacter sp.]|nr:metallophosphatase family protein [Maribacter sp.]
MKIAVISDIHGNSDALVEVLKKARKENVAHLLILGDIVGYYYYPDKILKLLADWSYDMIKGNHETILQDVIADPSIGESIRLKYGSGHQEAIHKLTAQQLQFLDGLPETKTVEFNGISILMSHGSPWANDYYIYPDCEMEIIRKCDSQEHDFVLIGHSHYAFAVKNENSILINPGSVGQSRQVGGKASWTIINTSNGCFQMLSTDYDVKELIAVVEEKDPEITYLKEVLKRT